MVASERVLFESELHTRQLQGGDPPTAVLLLFYNVGLRHGLGRTALFWLLGDAIPGSVAHHAVLAFRTLCMSLGLETERCKLFRDLPSERTLSRIVGKDFFRSRPCKPLSLSP